MAEDVVAEDVVEEDPVAEVEEDPVARFFHKTFECVICTKYSETNDQFNLLFSQSGLIVYLWSPVVFRLLCGVSYSQMTLSGIFFKVLENPMA